MFISSLNNKVIIVQIVILFGSVVIWYYFQLVFRLHLDIMEPVHVELNNYVVKAQIF